VTEVRLRKYQEQAVAAMGESASARVSQIVAMATGTGKTHTAHAFMGSRYAPQNARVLWVAHTGELIQQARKSAISQNEDRRGRTAMGGKSVPTLGIVQATMNMSSSRWTYSTVQTICKRNRLEDYLQHGLPSLVVLDEAHHAVSVSQQDHILRTLAWYWKLGDFDQAWTKAHDEDDTRTTQEVLHDLRPDFHVVGLTATPKRSDGVALSQVFEVISYEYSLIRAREEGYLKPFEAVSVHTTVPFQDVKVDPRTGEFVMTDLERVLETSNWVQLVADAWMERMHNQPDTMVFMPSVAMSREFTMKMNREQGIPAGHIDFEMCIDGKGRTTEESGMTYAAHRRYIIDELRSGNLKMIAGYSALLEGFDARNVAGVLWARPTKSDIVLTQGVGRALRTYYGVARQLQDVDGNWQIQYDDGSWHTYKENMVPFHTHCTVLDFVDVEASLLTAGTLWGDQKKPAKAEQLEDEDEDTSETEDLYEQDDLKTRERNDYLGTDKGVDGKGQVYTYKSLFRKADQDWFAYLGAQSARLGQGKVIFINPPRPDVVEEIRKRITTRLRWLEVQGESDPERAIQASEEITDLSDIKDFMNQFSIWIAQCPTEEKDDGKIIEQWWSSDAAAKLIGVADTGVTAFEMAMPYADQLADADNEVLVRKGRRWHSQAVTSAQLSQLTEKGFLVRLVDQHGVPRPLPTEVANMNRGDASALRNHLLAHVMVTKALRKIVSAMHIDKEDRFDA